MKTNRSLSLLRVNKELNQQVLGKLFYQDPCFTNIIDDKSSTNKMHNLYRCRLPKLFSEENNNKTKESRANSMFISSPTNVKNIKYSTECNSIKNKCDILLKKGRIKRRFMSNFNEFNSNISINKVLSPLGSQSSRKKSTEYSSNSPFIPLVDIKDDYKSNVNNSIHLIDKQYKLRLGLLKPFPFIAINLKNKKKKICIMTNEYIKAKLSSN